MRRNLLLWCRTCCLRALLAMLCSIVPLAGCSSGRPESVKPQEKDLRSELHHTNAAGPVFEDVTQAAGLKATYLNGEEAGMRSIVESLGGGVGVTDFDLDGLTDIFFPGGGKFIENEVLPGEPNSLWRNTNNLRFTNVSWDAEIASARYYSHGCAIGDFDADGFSDVVVTGYGGLQLYFNQGDGTFVESSSNCGMVDDLWSSSAACADFNSDGHLDLFLTRYVDWSWQKNPRCASPDGLDREVCSPQDFYGLIDVLFVNRGDGTFARHQQLSGIKESGKGLGVVVADLNDDTFVDIYVANDTTNNLLYQNDGKGVFKEIGVISGTAFDQRGVCNGSMGVAITDYNGDQKPDIWVTNYENETFALYHNDTQGMFRCLTESTGVTAIGTLYVGFGTVAGDFRKSGVEDIIVSNGHVMLFPVYSSIAQQALYLQNNGRGKLASIQFAKDSYFSAAHRGRGVVAADFDHDGRLDLVFSHVNEPASVLRNVTETVGQWVSYKLVGTASNRDGIGAKMILTTDSRSYFRTIVGGGSYLSQGPYEVYFGFPATEKIMALEIVWPNGFKETIGATDANGKYRLVEGDPKT